MLRRMPVGRRQILRFCESSWKSDDGKEFVMLNLDAVSRMEMIEPIRITGEKIEQEPKLIQGLFWAVHQRLLFRNGGATQS